MQNIVKLFSTVILILFIFTKCNEAEFSSRDFPFMILEEIVVQPNGVDLKVTVASVGNLPTNSYGFVYGRNIEPKINRDDSFAIGTEISPGSFNGEIRSGLLEDVIYYVRPYAIVDEVVIYGTEQFFTSQGSLPPEIFDFNPKSGEIGSAVTISGRNFSPSQIGNIVRFGSVNAQIDSASENTLYVTVPVLENNNQVTIRVITGGRATTSISGFKLNSAWTNLGTLELTPLNQRSVSFKIDNTAYIINTNSSNGNFRNFKFSGSLESIETFFTPSVFILDFSTAFAVNNKGYVVFDDQFYEFNPTNETWTRKADFPGKDLQRNTLFSIGLDGSAVVGFYGDSQELWSYNTTDDSWTRLGDFPAALAESGNNASDHYSFPLNGKGYLGFNNDLGFWEYDAANDSWTQKANPSLPIIPAAMIVDGKAFGGFSISRRSIVTSWYQYNPINDSWDASVRNHPSISSVEHSFGLGDKGYLIIKNFNNDVEIWEYDPSNLQ